MATANPRAEELRHALEGIAEETARLPGPALNALLPVLQQAQLELDRDLRAWVASGRSGERYTPQAYRSSLTGIRAALSTIQSLQPTLFQVLTRWAGAGGIAAQMARSHTAREFLMFDGRPVLMPTVPVRLAADLATGQSSPLERYFATTARNYSAEVLRDVHRELAVGVVRGENTDQLIARLMATGRAADRNNLLGGAWLSRAEYRAERVVRTELAAAYNRELDELHGELRQDFPGLLRRWDAHADARLCERCQELHGRTIDPAKGERFPNGEEGPPLHPNCRCRADLWRPEWTHLIGGTTSTASAAPPTAGEAPAPPAAPPAPPPRPRLPEAPGPAWRPPAPPASPPRPPTALLPPPGRRALTNNLASLATPAERMAALGMDAGAMHEALSDAPVAVKGGTVPAPGTERARHEAARTIRDKLREVLHRWAGIEHRESATPAGAESRGMHGFGVDAALGSRGIHHWTGAIAVSPAVHSAARRGFAMMAAGRELAAEELNGIRTLIHEQLHGCSPITFGAALRHGMIWEEITTEVLARRFIVEVAGVSGEAVAGLGYNLTAWSNASGVWNYTGADGAVPGSYGLIIRRGISTIAGSLKVTPAEAVRLIEEATIAQRRPGGTRPATADGYVRDLARRIVAAHERTTGSTLPPDAANKLFTRMSSSIFATTGRAP